MNVERERFVLPRAAERGTEIFAFGDVHGRADLLEALLAVAEREPRLEARRELVFLGDVVDRGPDSLGAVRLSLAAGERIGAQSCIRLMGNHEAMMRVAFDPESRLGPAIETLAAWIENGGAEVVEEFLPGVDWKGDARVLLGRVRAAMPAYLTDWLAGLRAHARSGGLLFVHAGVNPGFELESFLAAPWNVPVGAIVEDRHWAWVRAPFLRHLPGPQGHSGLFVVHGHTPNDGNRVADHSDQIRRFRLNLDGGSGFTGACKMGIFRGREVEVVTAHGPTNAALAV